MGDKPSEDHERADDTAKLELPSLSLPRLRRGRKKRTSDAVDVPPTPEPAARTEPAPAPAETTPAREAAPASAHRARQVPEPATKGALNGTTTVGEPAPAMGDAPGQRKAQRKRPGPPRLPGWVAALLTGLVVGVFGAALTWASLRGCDAVKGTESCGGTGLFLLVVIVVLMVLLGGLLLALLRVPEPRSTSFLGVGVLVVVVLVTLIQQLFSGWMFLVVPLLGAASYVLALRITTAFVEPTPERGPEHDVR